MRNLLRMLGLFAICLIAQRGTAQDQLPLSSLCNLQVQLTQGEHKTIRVEGVYLVGLEGEYLVAAGCSGRRTRIEFALKTHRNWDKLRSMVNEPYKRTKAFGDGKPVLVIFDGEFYGPPVPDPKLPEPIRRAYHAGWDNNAMTKLVVYSIQSVKALPADHPCAPPKSDPTQLPCLQPEPLPQRDGATNP
jgi:hypothetical protein